MASSFNIAIDSIVDEEDVFQQSAATRTIVPKGAQGYMIEPGHKLEILMLMVQMKI